MCPITSNSKGYPFEVPFPDGHEIDGVVLCDHIKCLDWRARNAKAFAKATEDVLAEVTARLLALIDPEE